MSVAVVVGGGMSGLAAARAFAAGGAREVILLEESDSLGGRVASIRLDTGVVDLGPDQFLRRDSSAEDWCRSLGLGEALVAPVGTTAGVWSYGKARELPLGLVLGVPSDLGRVEASSVVSSEGIAEAVKLAKSGLAPLSPAELGLDGSDAERSAGSILRERIGNEVVDRLVDPLLGGINAGSVDHLSLATTAPQIARAISGRSDVVQALAELPRTEAAGSPFFGLAGGFAQFVERAVSELSSLGVEVRTGVGADSIVAAEADSLVVAAGRERIQADAVVLATPAAETSRLLGGIAPGAGRILSDIPYASVVVTTMVLPGGSVAAPPGWTGLLVPRVEGLVTTAVSFLSRKWEWIGRQTLDGLPVEILRVSAGRFGDERAAAMADGELVDILTHELEELCSIASEPLLVHVQRWPSAFPQYLPGHGARMSALSRELAQHPPLALAGSLLGGIGVPACITSGTEAAARLTHRVRAAG